MTHQHRPNPHAWRLALARLHFDRHAERLITDEIDGCADCWRDIAGIFLDFFLDGMVINEGGWGRAVGFAEGAIQSSLDAADRDRGETR